MPTELEAILKKEMGYQIIAPSCMNCEHRRSCTDEAGTAHTCHINPVIEMPITLHGVCKLYVDKEIPF